MAKNKTVFFKRYDGVSSSLRTAFAAMNEAVDIPTVAKYNGIEYTGSAGDDLQMLRLLKEGFLIKEIAHENPPTEEKTQ